MAASVVETRTARDIVDSLILRQVTHLERKWIAFEGGDIAAKLTDLEINFLLSVRKLEQEAAIQDAARTYLQGLSNAEVYEFYREIHASLPEHQLEALPEVASCRS